MNEFFAFSQAVPILNRAQIIDDAFNLARYGEMDRSNIHIWSVE